MSAPTLSGCGPIGLITIPRTPVWPPPERSCLDAVHDARPPEADYTAVRRAVGQRHVTKSYSTTLQPMTIDRFMIALLLRNLDQPAAEAATGAALQDLRMACPDGDA